MAKVIAHEKRLRAELKTGAVWHMDFEPGKGLERIYVQRIANVKDQAEPEYHRHDGIQICLIRHGSTEVETAPNGPNPAKGPGVKRFPLAVGDGCVFPARQWHRWAWADTGGVDVLAFTFPAQPLACIQDTLSELSRMRVMSRVLDRNMYAASIARRLDLEATQRLPGHRDAIMALGLQLLVEVARMGTVEYSGSEEDRVRGGIGSAVSRARSYMTSRLAEPLLLEGIAQALDLSVSHLVRSFTEELGESPMRVLKKMRVEAVRNLLVTTDGDLQRIAVETGLTNAQHLCKAFRAEYGETPRAYRQRMWRAGLE